MNNPQELFRRLEREVRSPKEKLPIDTFLPSPDTLTTEFPDPPPSNLTAHAREIGTSTDEEQQKLERRRQRRARKPPARDAEQAPAPPLKLEDEILDFMNRDKPEAVEDEDFSQFLGGFDPSEIPEK